MIHTAVCSAAGVSLLVHRAVCSARVDGTVIERVCLKSFANL